MRVGPLLDASSVAGQPGQPLPSILSLQFFPLPSFLLFWENRTHQNEAETAPHSQGRGATTSGDLGCPVLFRKAKELLCSLSHLPRRVCQTRPEQP